ncbi:hypothetical protein EJB05_13838, partial [Eragrostis curvula]
MCLCSGNEQVEAEEDLQQDNIPQDREVEILNCPKACLHGMYKSPKVGPLIGSLMCRRNEACCYSNNSDGLRCMPCVFAFISVKEEFDLSNLVLAEW